MQIYLFIFFTESNCEFWFCYFNECFHMRHSSFKHSHSNTMASNSYLPRWSAFAMLEHGCFVHSRQQYALREDESTCIISQATCFHYSLACHCMESTVSVCLLFTLETPTTTISSAFLVQHLTRSTEGEMRIRQPQLCPSPADRAWAHMNRETPFQTGLGDQACKRENSLSNQKLVQTHRETTNNPKLFFVL